MSNWTALEVTAIITALGALVASLGTSIASLIVALKTGQKVDGMLVTRDASNVAAGERKGKLAGEQVAETLAEGQRQGREQAREEAKASNGPAAVLAPIGGPVPVTDDRVAVATESMADDTKRMADAAEAGVPAKSK